MSSIVYVLCLHLWFVWFLISAFVYLKKEQPTFAGWRSNLPYWLSGEHLPIMTIKRVACVPRFVIFSFNIFIIGGILWLYQTQVVYYLRASHRWDREQSEWLFMNSGYPPPQKNTLNLNLVKVHWLFFNSLFLNWVTELASGVPILPLWFIFNVLFWIFISVKAGHVLINSKLLMFSPLHGGRKLFLMLSGDIRYVFS